MVFSAPFATIHVPAVTTAARVCPFTVTETVVVPAAMLSVTVPERPGVLSFVLSVVTVTTGPVWSTFSSPAVLSVPTLPAVSVARTTTL